jgi:hypothetical protein
MYRCTLLLAASVIKPIFLFNIVTYKTQYFEILFVVKMVLLGVYNKVYYN